MDFSVVIPTFNETNNELLGKTLHNLLKIPNLEIIWVHCELAPQPDHWKTLHHPRLHKLLSQKDSRSLRLKEGCQKASGEYILLHHPRSLIDQNVFQFLKTKNDIYWGGLTHRFDHQHPLLIFTSWYSNQIRLKLRSICYLDHCIFFKKEKVDLDICFPNDVIFEDTLISEYLFKRLGPAHLIPFKSTTSAKRFIKNGIFKQAFLNQILKLAFIFKASPEAMNKIYEKGLGLNNDYEKN